MAKTVPITQFCRYGAMTRVIQLTGTRPQTVRFSILTHFPKTVCGAIDLSAAGCCGHKSWAKRRMNGQIPDPISRLQAGISK